MEGEGPPAEPKQISIWDKFKSNTLKSIRISYMNWTYLPRWNGEEETVVDKLFRYSHFPMATQVFTYFAYRAACQNLYGRFFLYSTGIQYFLQDLNYTHCPMYRVDNKEKQMLMQLGEAAVLGALSTLIATRIHKVPRNSFKYYCITTGTVMVPSIAGLLWSHRDHFLNGNMIFSPSGAVLGLNKQAGIEGTCYIALSRGLGSIANLTVPLLCMRFFEKNMAFFTPLKGIIFTEITLIASCLLTPVAMGLVHPIGTVSVKVPTTTVVNSEDVEDVENLENLENLEELEGELEKKEEKQEEKQADQPVEESPEKPSENSSQPEFTNEKVFYFRGY